jgi:predicted nucleic acid-binding protein
MIVVDTNLIAYLFIGGPKTGLAENALRKDPEWCAPLLWRSEFRNILAVYMHRGYLTHKNALQLIQEAERLLAGAEFQVESSTVLNLAALSQCSAYDCEFVALAQQLGVMLITSDRQILSQFPSSAVSLHLFAGS